MRCESLVYILIVSIVLMANIKPVCTRKSPHRQMACKPGSSSNGNQPICKSKLESTKMISNAANEATAAKDAQSCAGEEASKRAMNQLAEKATQAARAAEAALDGKKHLLDQLEQREAEADAIIEEVNKALARSLCNLETTDRVAQEIQALSDQLQVLSEDTMKGLAKIQKVACNTKKEMQNKQELMIGVKQRLEDVLKCMIKDKKDLEHTEQIAQQAECAANEARQRIEAIQNVSNKFTNLKKRDLESLIQVLKIILKK